MKSMNGEVLFSLGEMARLTQLSPKALRFYDERGVLRPRWRDPETGYRYYDIDQLYYLGNMRISKQLGMALDDYDETVVSADELLSGDFAPVAQRIEAAAARRISTINEATSQLHLLTRLAADIELLRSHPIGGESFELELPQTTHAAFLPSRRSSATLDAWYEVEPQIEWACVPRYGRLQGLGTLLAGFVDVRGFCCEVRDTVPARALDHLHADVYPLTVAAGVYECWLVTRPSSIESWEAVRGRWNAAALSESACEGAADGKLVLMQELGFFERYEDAVYLVRVVDDPR